MDFRSFLSELKRRRVVRTAVVYAAAAFVVVQVADLVFPALQFPEWTYSFVVVLSILGFPVAVVLAWTLERTSEGLRRERAGGGAGRAGPGGVGPEGPAAVRREAPAEGGGDADAGPRHGRDAASVPAGAAGTEEPARKGIAVLPFVNLSDDRENEYFSDGVTEEILNALVKVRDLKVASRTSSFAFKGREGDIREIAEKLGVATVLEGSVRKAGGRVRITAQLIDSADGYHIWSESYDRELKDIFAIQDDIARSIVDALRGQLVADDDGPLVVQDTEDVEAYTLYLKGRFFFNKFTEPDLRKSLEFYERALEEDPEYARAHAGIADSWMNLADDWVAPTEAYPAAREAARRASELEPDLAEGHTALGKVLAWYDWDFDAGELALRRAVAANPKYADAHWGLGTVLPATGHLGEAIEEMRIAQSLDPLSPTFGRWVARFLLYARRWDEAIEESRRTLELDPGHAYAYAMMGFAELMEGDVEGAIESFRRGSEVGDLRTFDAFVAHALALGGRREEARGTLEAIVEASEEGYVRAEYVAAARGALGERDEAFRWLDRALEERSAGLVYLHLDPAYDPLRDDARFTRFVEAVGVR